MSYDRHFGLCFGSGEPASGLVRVKLDASPKATETNERIGAFFLVGERLVEIFDDFWPLRASKNVDKT